MNKEELIGKLQMIYVGDKNALDELIGYYDGLKQGIEELKADYGTQVQVERDMLQQENKILKENAENNDKVVDKVNWENMLLKKENEQLKDNWNKLKEWLEEMINEIKTNDIYDRTEYECTQITTLENVLAKLEEIGGGINGFI